MKDKFLISCLLTFCSTLCSQTGHDENPHFEWIEGKEVAVLEDGIYIDSNKGLMLLNVVEYDRMNERYLVKCSCMESSHLTPLEALSCSKN